MSSRVARLERLLGLQRDRATREEQKVAVARLHRERSEVDVERASARLAEGEARAREATTVVELSDGSARCQTLRLGLDAARARAQTAARELAAREADLIAARLAVRRFELLIENLQRGEAVRAARVERRAADELAARRRSTRWTTRG